MFIYVVMAFWASIGLAFNTAVVDDGLRAPTGALMTLSRCGPGRSGKADVVRW